MVHYPSLDDVLPRGVGAVRNKQYRPSSLSAQSLRSTEITGVTEVKAITICQPYAELIARRAKRVENREWPTNYRGDLLIHAGKSRAWLGGDTDEDLFEDYDRHIEFGAIVAKANLVACLHIERIARGDYDSQFPWLREHEHTNGTWCWVLADVERLPKAIPWRGAQGLWDYSFPDAVSGDQG